MDLLIYGPAIFAGIIGSRYVSRLANFCVTIAVFQLDLAILIGKLSAVVLTPYTVICIIPALAGIVGDKYLHVRKIANALLIIAVFWLGGVLLAYEGRKQFMPLSVLTGIFISPGFVVPPLVFILVAIVAYRLRRHWQV